MEVGYERIDALEFVGRIYEYIRLAAAGADDAVFARGAFERAHGSCADGYYAPSFRLCPVERGGSLFAYLVILAVHLVVGYDVLLYGAECTQPDVKENLDNLDAHTSDFFEKFGREMQSCRRRRCRAVRLGIYRLISVLILELFLYIRGKRHGAYLLQYIFKHSVVGEIYYPFAAVGYSLYGKRQLVAYFKALAHGTLPAGFCKHLPLIPLQTL